MIPCRYEHYMHIDIFKTFEKNGELVHYMCPPNDLSGFDEVEINSNEFLEKGQTKQIIGINILKCEGVDCASGSEIKQKLKNTFVKAYLFQPDHALEEHEMEHPVKYTREFVALQ